MKRKITTDGLSRGDIMCSNLREHRNSKRIRLQISKLYLNFDNINVKEPANLYFASKDENLPRQNQSTEHLPSYYNSCEVYHLWKDCISYSVKFTDPIHCHTRDVYLETIRNLNSQINANKKKVQKGQFLLLDIDFDTFDRSSYHKQRELAVAYEHEVNMYQKKHKRCSKCQAVSIVKEYILIRNQNINYHCFQCRQMNIDNFWKMNSDMLLPVWFDDNNEVQFNIPEELRCLRLGEQLLIQRLSCFIPIVHIKNGIMGLHGHCVSFRQDIIEICNILPRTRVNAIKIIKSYNTAGNIGLQDFDMFIIRRDIVLSALKWLKKYHKWYREDPDLIIQESNLDWMQGKQSACLIGTEGVTTNLFENKEFDSLIREHDDENQCGM